MVDYAYATTHQPGARYAPLYFLAGQIFTQDAHQPDLSPRSPSGPWCSMIGTRTSTSPCWTAFLPGRANWQAQRIAPTLGVPHWERLPETIAAHGGFLGRTGLTAPRHRVPVHATFATTAARAGSACTLRPAARLAFHIETADRAGVMGWNRLPY